MRDIKFRAWNTEDKVMIEWIDMLKHKGVMWSVLGNTTVTRFMHQDDTIGETAPLYRVMQFTGLQDIKGVDIYEGDIVRPTSGVVGSISIVFHNGAFTCTDGACHWWMVSDSTSMPKEFGSDTDMEVIGNIYETPELLK